VSVLETTLKAAGSLSAAWVLVNVWWLASDPAFATNFKTPNKWSLGRIASVIMLIAGAFVLGYALQLVLLWWMPDEWLEWYGQRDASAIRSSLSVPFGVLLLFYLSREALPDDVAAEVARDSRKSLSVKESIANLIRDGAKLRQSQLDEKLALDERLAADRVRRMDEERNRARDSARVQAEAVARRRREIRLLNAMTPSEFDIVLLEMRRSLISWNGPLRSMTREEQEAYLSDHRELVPSQFISRGLLDEVENRLAKSEQS
jgi:hypothetical protein